MSNPRDKAVAYITSLGLPQDRAEAMVAGFTDEQVEKLLEDAAKAVADRDALRQRLTGSVLGRAVCPARDWQTADDRYDVARQAVRIVDATAEKHGITPEELAQALVDTQGTLAESIAMHGRDPRSDGFPGTPNFYAFRWRVRNALEHLGLDEETKRKAAEQAKREAYWAQHGLVRCDRCGGIGGADHWPGFTCYDCGGLGGVTPK